MSVDSIETLDNKDEIADLERMRETEKLEPEDHDPEMEYSEWQIEKTS